MSADSRAADRKRLLDAAFGQSNAAAQQKKRSADSTSIVRAKPAVDIGWNSPPQAPSSTQPPVRVLRDKYSTVAESEAVYYSQLPLQTFNIPAVPFVRRAIRDVATAQTAVHEVLKGLLQGHKGCHDDAALSKLVTDRMGHRALILDKTRGPADAQGSRDRAARAVIRAKQSEGVSNKQCKRKGLGPTPSGAHAALTFAAMLPLHELWKQYAADGLARDKNAQRFLLSADLQGCFLKVEKSSTASLIGLTGIVVEETNTLFLLMGTDSRIRRVPKAGCVFALAAGGVRVTLHGATMIGRQSVEKALQQQGFKSASTTAAEFVFTAL
jgi:RNase P/RNase MRP subunit p29